MKPRHFPGLFTGCFLCALIAGLPAAALAGEADVTDVNVRRSVDDTYRFSVTVHHADSGWDHYADQWQVLTPEGEVLAIRTLHHPHVDEQPFTRSLGGVGIPPGVSEVRVRARDSVHGHGGREMVIRVPD